MKKLLALTLVLIMMFTFTACDNGNVPADTSNNDTPTTTVPSDDETPTVTPPADDNGASIKAPEVDENTLGYVFWNEFKTIKSENPEMSAEEIAHAILNTKAGRIAIAMGGAFPVEAGFLQGFDNFEVKGFKSGAAFAPGMMGVPFIGYIFELEEGADISKFTSDLKNNCNLNWNICTSADMSAVGSYNNTVFFVMCQEKVPSAISGIAEIIEPTAENAPQGMKLWDEFKAIMTLNPEAITEGIAYQMIDSASFTYGEGVVGEIAEDTMLDGFVMELYAIGNSFKAEGNDSFAGYIFNLGEGVDVQNWLDFTLSCVEDGNTVVAGAYNSVVIILLNTDSSK